MDVQNLLYSSLCLLVQGLANARACFRNLTRSFAKTPWASYLEAPVHSIPLPTFFHRPPRFLSVRGPPPSVRRKPCYYWSIDFPPLCQFHDVVRPPVFPPSSLSPTAAAHPLSSPFSLSPSPVQRAAEQSPPPPPPPPLRQSVRPSRVALRACSVVLPRGNPRTPE